MSEKIYRTTFRKRIYGLFLIIAISLFSFAGCKTGLFNGESQPETPNTPQAPPAPVVVDGVRTSYADIVERTSPAVVNIGSERKAQKANSRRVTRRRVFRPIPFSDSATA